MAEQIDELFVRLGLEQDQQQFKQAEDSFDSLRGKALQFGAVIGAGFGIGELTFGFSDAVNEARKLSEEFEELGVTPQFVNQLRGAFALIQEDASEADSTIRNIADLIEDTDWGDISEAAFSRGFDISAIRDAENMTEAMAALNEQMRDMDQEQGRRMGQALGMSSAQIRMFQGENISALMQDVAGRRPRTDEQVEAAEEFATGVTEFTQVIEGLRDTLSADFVGEIGEGLSDMADILEENRDAVLALKEPLAGAAAGIGTLVALRAGRAAVGALGNIPGVSSSRLVWALVSP
jgi:hypothetical protein